MFITTAKQLPARRFFILLVDSRIQVKKNVRVGIRRCKPDYAVLESLAASTQLLQATLTCIVYIPTI